MPDQIASTSKRFILEMIRTNKRLPLTSLYKLCGVDATNPREDRERWKIGQNLAELTASGQVTVSWWNNIRVYHSTESRHDNQKTKNQIEKID